MSPWHPFFSILPRRVKVVIDPSSPALAGLYGSETIIAFLRWVERGRPEYRITARPETEDEFTNRQW